MNNPPNLNPMFRKPSSKKKVDWESMNVRKKKRAERIDKKHDIKIALTEDLMKRLSKQAFSHGMTNTNYAAYLIKKGLKMDISLFPEVLYQTSKTTVHAKLSKYEFEQLFEYRLSFKFTSMRKAAHRILVEMIERGDCR